MELEAALVGLEYVDAEQIGGQHIVGELHALVFQPQHGGKAGRQRGFAHARHVFQQNMPAGENAGEQLFEHGLFAENDGVELFENGVKGGVGHGVPFG